MRLIPHIILLSVLALVSGGCASLVSYKEQLVTVSTGDIEKADCTLTTGSGETTRVRQTPDQITLRRALDKATVFCRKEGFPDGLTEVRSTFSPITLGNALLLLFGLIPGPGWWIGGSLTVAAIGYDFISNAVWTWPTRINVDLVPPDSSGQPSPVISPASGPQRTLHGTDTLIIDLSKQPAR